MGAYFQVHILSYSSSSVQSLMEIEEGPWKMKPVINIANFSRERFQL